MKKLILIASYLFVAACGGRQQASTVQSEDEPFFCRARAGGEKFESNFLFQELLSAQIDACDSGLRAGYRHDQLQLSCWQWAGWWRPVLGARPNGVGILD